VVPRYIRPLAHTFLFWGDLMNKYFTEEEIEKIISSDKVCDYDIKTLDIRCEDLFKYFNSKKINNVNIKKMILDYPRLLTYSLDLIKDRYDNVYKIFVDMTNKLLISNPRIFSRTKEMFNDRFKYFRDLEIEEKDIIRMFLNCPTICTLGEVNLDISISNLLDNMKDKELVIELIVKNSIVLSYSNKTINDKFKWFYDKGYTNRQSAYIVSKAETILTLDFGNNNGIDGNMDRKYKYLLQDLKYTKEEIVGITYLFAEYYALGLDTLKNRFDNLIRLGFGFDNAKKIFYNYPKILSIKEETLNDKYDYYLKLDMLNIFMEKPKYLMQSIELTDARYKYLINKGLEVSKTNYDKLFVSSKRFKKNYGIDNDELLNKNKENGGNYEERRNYKITK